ncbi:unnamed protein product [Clonostachys solani]|uniref:Protein SnodProt1 n=1 Tax=Clonostachys solani TaxID=160281 RepID=A0A9N9ZBQ1_9HYPO|nr:unnamed protein product [Clonostachys solani]
MQFSTIATFLGLAAAASAVTVSYDTGYDDGNRLLTAVTCSDGANGLITRYGWTTQGQIPTFSNIGGMQGVGWNSPQCGTCWKLEYNGNSINVLAIDSASAGYNIAKAALDRLTNGQAEQLGRIEATASQVGLSDCGIN